MGVYIKGMKMPNNCNECAFINRSWGLDYYCPIAQDYNDYIHILKQKMKDCPLIEIPEPHGDLIDADALNYTMLYEENWMRGTGVEALAVWRKDIDAAPTIIPASEEGE